MMVYSKTMTKLTRGFCNMRDEILTRCAKKYKTKPEHLWKRWPGYVVLRRNDNNKWYAVIMDVPRNKLGMDGRDVIDIINVKCDAGLYALLPKDDGIRRAYHMGGTWVSVLLDGSVDIDQVWALVNASYNIVGQTKPKKHAQ